LPLQPLRFPIESNPGRFGHDGLPRLVNCRAVRRDTSGKNQWQWNSVPGLEEVAEIDDGGACRGLFKVSDALALVVSGNRVVSLTPALGQTFIGGFLGTKPVYFARNRKSPDPQVVLVSNGQRRVYEAGTLATIDDADLKPPNSCDALGPYILYGHDDGTFSYSAIDDATSIAALSVTEAEGKPDGLVRLKTRRKEVWLFGQDTTEIWTITQDVNNPFEPLGGTYIDLGCLAPASVVQMGEAIAWVASDYTVRLAQDYASAVISIDAVSRAIKGLSDPTAIEAFVYREPGVTNLVLNSPSWTWVMSQSLDKNAPETRWHEQESIGLGRRRFAHCIDFGGMQLCGDSDGATLYNLTLDSGADGDSELMSRIITEPQHAYPGEVEYNALYLDPLPGSGLNTPSNSETLDPVLMVRDSDDGGQSWSNQIDMPIGRQGQSRTRAVAHQLGTSGEDGRAFEIAWDAAANKGITGGMVDVVPIAP
jgi:hypothetical protein